MHILASIFDFFFYTGNWPPRWRCGNWSTALGYTSIISELLVWGAYMAIPILIVYFIKKRGDIPFLGIFWLFAAFIISCGFTHLMEAIIFYFPAYRFLALIVAFTALISWITVIALIPALPKALELPGLASLSAKLSTDLSSTQSRLETALHTLQAGVWDWDLSKNSVALSQTISDQLVRGGGEDKLSQSDFFEWVYYQDREMLLEKIQDTLRIPEVQSARIRFLNGRNQVVPTVLRWQTMFDEGNEPIRVIGTLVKVH